MSGHLPGRASIINFAGGPGGRATIARVRAACPGSHASQVSALQYLVLGGTDHASRRGQGSMIGRSIIGRSITPAAEATRHRRAGRSLRRRWLAARARAHPGARRSSSVRTAPANAGSRTVRTGTARPPGRPGTPCRSRVRTDHTSHSSLSALGSAGPGAQSRCTALIASHLTSAVPARPDGGHRIITRPVRSSIRDEVRAFRRASATRFRRWRAPRARGGGRGCRPPGAPGRWPATMPRSVYRGPAGRG